MIAEMDAANGWAIVRRYVPGPGTDEPVVWYEGSGTSDRRWLHADERGSIVAVTGSAGAVSAINAYDEYGLTHNTLTSDLAVHGRFRYTGQAYLPEIGLYYYKARMYSPTLGRFMQTDPIGYGDGMNMYAYVGNDPVNGVDPTGTVIVVTANRPFYCDWACATVNRWRAEGLLRGRHGLPEPWPRGDVLHQADPGEDDSDEMAEEQRNESEACQELRGDSDSAFNLLPYATTGPNTWSDPGWLRAQRHVYERNRDQAWYVATAALATLGMDVSDALRSSRNPSGRIVLSRGAVWTGLAAGAAGTWAASEVEKYQGYMDAIDDRLQYLRGCTSIK